jgi:hypothetical protein
MKVITFCWRFALPLLDNQKTGRPVVNECEFDTDEAPEEMIPAKWARDTDV